MVEEINNLKKNTKKSESSLADNQKKKYQA